MCLGVFGESPRSGTYGIRDFFIEHWTEPLRSVFCARTISELSSDVIIQNMIMCFIVFILLIGLPACYSRVKVVIPTTRTFLSAQNCRLSCDRSRFRLTVGNPRQKRRWCARR